MDAIDSKDIIYLRLSYTQLKYHIRGIAHLSEHILCLAGEKVELLRQAKEVVGLNACEAYICDEYFNQIKQLDLFNQDTPISPISPTPAEPTELEPELEPADEDWIDEDEDLIPPPLSKVQLLRTPLKNRVADLPSEYGTQDLDQEPFFEVPPYEVGTLTTDHYFEDPTVRHPRTTGPKRSTRSELPI
jgi:hypothetical protein